MEPPADSSAASGLARLPQAASSSSGNRTPPAARVASRRGPRRTGRRGRSIEHPIVSGRKAGRCPGPMGRSIHSRSLRRCQQKRYVYVVYAGEKVGTEEGGRALRTLSRGKEATAVAPAYG